ncbi:hypothetical protein HVMH_1985 [Hydrogenovibrio marinus]|nr:hypothetical protein HVMH_1985 [Hydrogenovibrio marinus]
MLPKIVRSRLANKIYMPVLLTIFIGLLVIIINSFYTLTNITDIKYQEIRKTYQNYLKRAYESKASVALTNAISLSQNPIIIHALETGQRDDALKLLQHISSSLGDYSSFKNIRIHVHTANLKSFIRSWRPNDYGDDLSGFRDSLIYVKQNQQPFVVSEIGRAGLLLRGISPVLSNGKYLGSIEFATGYENIGRSLQQDYGLDFVVLAAPSDSKSFKRFHHSKAIGDRYLAMDESAVEPELLKALKGFQSIDIRKTGMMIRNNLFLTSIPIKNLDNNVIGCLMVGDKMSHITAIVGETRRSMIIQILFMALIDLLILLSLTWMIKRNVIAPIMELSEDVKSFSKNIGRHLPTTSANENLLMRRDELGGIARAFNKSAKHILYLFKKVGESQKVQDEYLKAVYAGSIVSKGDLEGNITFVNDELCKATGYSSEELIGQPHSILREPSTPKSTFRQMWQIITTGHIWHGLLKNKRKDGSVFYANTTIVPILTQDGEISEYIALRYDVSELVNSQRQLRKSLLSDTLTQLDNRFKLLDDIKKDDPKFMAIFDIRAFKELNDFYGYEIGDRILTSFSKYLFDQVKNSSCSVYRLQGDEFALVSFSKEQSLDDFIDRVKVMQYGTNNQMISVDDHKIIIDLTIGVAQKHEDLLFEAALAHKNAKRRNKTMVIFEENHKQLQEQQNNIEWVKKLKTAILDNRIKSFYQPIVNNKTGQIDKHESLVRFKTPEGELIGPFMFLDIAKRARLYTATTQIMIQHVFATLARYQGDFSINLSMEDIHTPEILEFLIEKLEMEPQFGSRLVLEIVESESIQSFDMVESFINTMRTYGCQVAVDDFGTGYSNFEFLLNLHPDYIKIDGSLIKNLPQDQKAHAIVESIVSFAKKNGIKTIAEFVHSEEVYQAVKELGIDYSQGYLLGKPEAEPKA